MFSPSHPQKKFPNAGPERLVFKYLMFKIHYLCCLNLFLLRIKLYLEYYRIYTYNIQILQCKTSRFLNKKKVYVQITFGYFSQILHVYVFCSPLN